MTNSQAHRPDRALHHLVLGGAAVTTGLVAGTFYVFSCAVMPALGRSDDRTFIEVMRNINDVIENPVFFAGFFGAPALIAAAAWQQRRSPGPRGWLFAAFAVYAVAFLLTSGVSVPLNDELARAGNPARIADPAVVRDRFENAWVAWNAARAVLCTAALALLLRASRLLGRQLPQESAHPASDAGSRASR
ncbi:anthrone oxygenase family protein [Streptomyces sp. NPDC048669]|uniref:anthrone oxygenase family protein n=1 Tax=Streptomyces sp. NPDC048669 TaxID=3155267 RepID=UPI00342E8ECE